MLYIFGISFQSSDFAYIREWVLQLPTLKLDNNYKSDGLRDRIPTRSESIEFSLREFKYLRKIFKKELLLSLRGHKLHFYCVIFLHRYHKDHCEMVKNDRFISIVRKLCVNKKIHEFACIYSMPIDAQTVKFVLHQKVLNWIFD